MSLFLHSHCRVSASVSGSLHPLSVPASTEEEAWGADDLADDRYDRRGLPGSGKEAGRGRVDGRPGGGRCGEMDGHRRR